MYPRLLLTLCSIFTVGTLFAQWSSSGNNIYNTNSGYVGVGTTSPTRQLTVTSGTGVGPLLVQGPAGYMLIDNQGAGSNYFQANTLHQFQGTSNAPIMTLLANGNIGIGATTNPAFPLDVPGVIHSSVIAGNNILVSKPTGAAISFDNGASVSDALIEANSSGHNLEFWSGQPLAESMVILGNGNILIGKSSQSNSTYRLDVNGNLRVNQIVVNTDGADFVFDSSYRLPALTEVGAYIRLHHHLPGVAAADQLQKDGVELGSFTTKLLQKVEELTLYSAEADKRLNEQQTLLLQLQAQLKAQQAEIDRLKAQEAARQN